MPTPIRHYELADVLGSGALGVTYRALDTRTSAAVALKVVHERISQDAEILARLRQEARTARQLDHPNIARLLEQGDERGVAYIASEFVEGETLRARLDRQGRLSEREAHGIALCVAHALNAASAMRVLHRDLRPENVLVGDDGRLSVSDFSLIQALDATTPTRVVAFVAAPEYAAPELDEQRADIRSDLFSLGVILFETLVGRVPLSASARADARRTVLEQGDAALLTRAAPSLSVIVLRLLERDPQRRYADPAQCIAAMQAISEDGLAMVPAELVSGALPERRGRSWSAFRAALRWPARGLGAMVKALRAGATARGIRRNVQIGAAILIAATMVGGAGGLIAANTLGGGDDGNRPSTSAAIKPGGAAPSRTPSVTRTPSASAARSKTASPIEPPTPQQGVAGAAATPPGARTARAGKRGGAGIGPTARDRLFGDVPVVAGGPCGGRGHGTLRRCRVQRRNRRIHQSRSHLTRRSRRRHHRRSRLRLHRYRRRRRHLRPYLPIRPPAHRPSRCYARTSRPTAV